MLYSLVSLFVYVAIAYPTGECPIGDVLNSGTSQLIRGPNRNSTITTVLFHFPESNETEVIAVQNGDSKCYGEPLQLLKLPKHTPEGRLKMYWLNEGNNNAPWCRVMTVLPPESAVSSVPTAYEVKQICDTQSAPSLSEITASSTYNVTQPSQLRSSSHIPVATPTSSFFNQSYTTQTSEVSTALTTSSASPYSCSCICGNK